MKNNLSLVAICCFMLFSFTKTDIQEVWKAPAEAKKLKNPVSESGLKKSAKKGGKIFNSYCVLCHGDQGKGDGPGAKALDPKPANLTSKRVQDQVDGEIFWKITNGRGAMAQWKNIISEEDRWNIVNYIRTLN